MKFFVSLLFLTIAMSTALAFRLVVNVPNSTTAPDAVYVTGDFRGKCFWEADCLRMEKIGRFTFALELSDEWKGREFKLTRGTWDKEAATSTGWALDNLTFPKHKQEEVMMSVANWKDLQLWGVEGTVYEFSDFYSPELTNSRTIRVWVPTSYHQTEQHFPVIYMHDGQNLFDIRTSAFGNEWGMDELLNNAPDQAIVVGIDSTGQRNAEYTYDRKGHLYADFLIDTLMPFINRKFRTLKGRETTYLMGSSMGALISFSLLWKHSDVFSRAAGLSFPAFAHDDQIFKFLQKYPQPPEDIYFYLDHGGQGQDKNYRPSVTRFVSELNQKYGLPMDSISYQVFPWADHTEVDWSRRLPIPVRFLLGDEFAQD